MSMLATKRVIKAGFVNFSRNGIISLASVLITIVTLFVIASLLLMQYPLSASLSEIKNKVDITVYFNTDAPASQVASIKSSLEQLPEVALVTYTPAAKALADFQAKHTNDTSTLQALAELDNNPLGDELNVKAKDPSQYQAINDFLSGDTGLSKDDQSIIHNINYNQNKLVIDRLTALIRGAERLGFGAALILVIISILITFNTIRLTIYIAREEIGVMRLVGAENKYIRGPFMIEGVIYGAIAAFVTMLIFYPLTLWMGNNMTSFLGVNLYDYYIYNFFEILLALLLSGILMCSISSFFAVSKYLKK